MPSRKVIMTQNKTNILKEFQRGLFILIALLAHVSIQGQTLETETNLVLPLETSYRAACIGSSSQTDLNINNVRVRLRAGGDVWWDGNNSHYVVPNIEAGSGEPEVSALFAGAIWLGAYDDGGNLILAAQTYRGRGNDYWTGPLDPDLGDYSKTRM